MNLKFIPKSEFDRIRSAQVPWQSQLQLIATMCRLNTLVSVKKAGSGHIGSSFSAMDIVVFLYYHYMNTLAVGLGDPNRDVYFSSKGHDVPGFYSVLFSLGVIPEDKFLMLRRLGGLDGHPDIGIPGVEANSGSLGMGISKGKGKALAKRYFGRSGTVFVLVGDGEFQEGQNFEALQSAVRQKTSNLVVIMDHNKLQSDRRVEQIVSLGDLEMKIRSFGWHVSRCDGHDYQELHDTFRLLEQASDKPRFLICDTIKGKGISFMEHPNALEVGGGYYRWHAGAPDDESFQRGFDELSRALDSACQRSSLGLIAFKNCPIPPKQSSGVSDEYVAAAYGSTLVRLAQENDRIIVLDADLSADCRLREFENRFPDRFVEVGIAEQDMVSMGAGLASEGVLPIVNTFANFLASRANEQVYNSLSENNKVIYVCHYAGLIPAGPGKSHQSIRDISLFGAFPNCTILQAANADEARMILDYAVEESKESCMIRLIIGPSPRIVPLPREYKLRFGQGVSLTEGREIVLMAYGPVMLNEALTAAEKFKASDVSLKVINMPWLNRFDPEWVSEELSGCRQLFILEDHAPFGGLGDHFASFLGENDLLRNCSRIHKLAVCGYPACGTPSESLKFHGLDGLSLAERILKKL